MIRRALLLSLIPAVTFAQQQFETVTVQAR